MDLGSSPGSHNSTGCLSRLWFRRRTAQGSATRAGVWAHNLLNVFLSLFALYGAAEVANVLSAPREEGARPER